MTWISLVCLLAISSSALARSVSYSQYGAAPLPQASSMNLVRDFTPSLSQGYGQTPSVAISQEERVQPEITPVSTGYGQQYGTPSIRRPIVLDQSYGKVQLPVARSFPSQYQLLEDQKQQLRKIVEESTVLSEADILCRGKAPETVIPLDGGRRFVVCIDESKGHEQVCPRGLLYHPESRRCERKLGPLENPCSSQPCLNGGQCVQTDFTSYKCQCSAGFDGEHCELDATVCQTQQPCGQSPDTRCQSFRYGAALQHICILQGGRAYGLTASQASPSPCTGVDGTFPLTFSDKGFIMCNGELMYIESCPGGTVWDDLNKACVWPDMQGLKFDEPAPVQTPSYSYGTSSYGQVPLKPKLIKDETFSGYGEMSMKPKLIKEETFSGYGEIPMKPKLIKEETFSGYGEIPMKPKVIKDETFTGYGEMSVKPFPKVIKDETISSYGEMPMKPFTQPKLISDEEIKQPTYGGYSQTFAKPPVFTQPAQREFIRKQSPY